MATVFEKEFLMSEECRIVKPPHPLATIKNLLILKQMTVLCFRKPI